MLHFVTTANPRDPMTAPIDEGRLLLATEAAKRLRTTPINVVRLCRDGKLRATKPLGRWLISEAAIDELMQANSNAVEETNGGAA